MPTNIKMHAHAKNVYRMRKGYLSILGGISGAAGGICQMGQKPRRMQATRV
jgi:hypothetical protein